MRLLDFLCRDVLGIIFRGERPRAWIKFANRRFGEVEERTGVEIGVCEGYNAFDIVDNLNIKKLYLVDPYRDYKELKDKNPELTWAERKARRKLMWKNNVEWIKKFSKEAAKEIPNELDFVYIDGNHAYKYIKDDIETYWKKLRQGGIIAGHDIENAFCEEHDGVTKAVIEFAIKNKLKLYIHAPDWWMIK